jgi:hypothetical protein
VSAAPTPEHPASDPVPILPPAVPLRTITLVRWGILAWTVVLLVLVLVPGWRSGEQSWWLWVPVAGIVLGVVGYVYLRRGRGNAAMA